MRNVALSAPEDLERADVAALIGVELALARVPMQASAGRQVIVKSVSARQRPRR